MTKSLSKSKEPSWVLSYKKKNAGVVKLAPLKSTKIFSLDLFNKYLLSPSVGESKTIVSGAKEFSLSNAPKEVLGLVKSALSLERAPRDQFEAFVNSNFATCKIFLIEKDAHISVDAKEGVSEKHIILISSKKPVSVLYEVKGNSALLSSTVLCEKNTDAQILVIPKASGLFVSQSIVLAGAKLLQSNAWGFADKSRAYYSNISNGEGASIKQNDIVFLQGSEENHVTMSSVHAKPEGFSQTRVKCVLLGSSKSSFDGLIKILPGAQLTQSYLEVNSMLLSDDAKSINIPKLEIEADDVKATHSATVEHIDEEKRFYLQSRGIDNEETDRIIVSSSLEGVLVEFTPTLSDKVKELVLHKISNFHSLGAKRV